MKPKLKWKHIITEDSYTVKGFSNTHKPLIKLKYHLEDKTTTKWHIELLGGFYIHKTHGISTEVDTMKIIAENLLKTFIKLKK